MSYPALSPPWCFACGAAAEETKLWPCNIARTYTAPDGRRRTRTIPVALCDLCIRAAIRASDRVRSGTLARRTGRPKAPPGPGRPAKPSSEELARRGRRGAATTLARCAPVRGLGGRLAGSRPVAADELEAGAA